jgi:hypothetical protein
MSTPVPDLKPHVPPAAAGNECCGCCEGIKAETPQALFNRGGLSAIRYRIGEYADFRQSLHAALSSSAFSPLSLLRSRDDDEFSIGLIDAFACSADVLTFYQERIANESFLRTAVERVSLQEMGKLVGYRLRPGVAAETWLAFALDTPPIPPANLAPEPGNFVTGVPPSLTLESGLKVQSVPGPGEKPQTFELVETLDEARPAWNAIRPWLAEAHFPGRDEHEAWLAGVANNLKPGDALLFVGQEFVDSNDSDNWDLRLITDVTLDSDNDRTHVAWARGLGSSFPFSDPASQTFVFAMRKRAAVFGNNAPVWRSMDPRFRAGYAAKFGGGANDGEWRDFFISEVAPTAAGGAVDLDSVQSEIAADVAGVTARRSFAILAKGGFNQPDENFPSGTYVELYRVTGTTEVSRANFAISGKVTRLHLAGENLDKVFKKTVRETSVYGKSELLPLADRPVNAPVNGDRVPVHTSVDGLLPGRRLVIRGTRTSNNQPVTLRATLVAAHAVGTGRCELEITPPLPFSLLRASVVVHANVALASHGESVFQILGAGNASQSFQRFELQQLPLTYRAAGNEIGAAAELAVRVGDVTWKELPTMYPAAPTERAFTLETDEQGRRVVAFGDGLRGVRLPSGVNNVRAAYRKGLGAEGNVGTDKLTQLMTRPLGLKSVSNPLPAEGGTDPEEASAARQTIPLTTRTLGRTVSLLDYEDFARAFSGIVKASAAVLQPRNGQTIAITLAAPNGGTLTPTNPIWQNLLAALKSSGDPHVDVTLLDHQASTFRLGLRVKVDPVFESKAVLSAVEAALRAHFAFETRTLGQPVQQSDVIAVSQAVPGVVAIDLSRLYGGTQPVAQTLVSLQVRLLASRMRVEGGIARPAELLTLDPAPLDELEEMA